MCLVSPRRLSRVLPLLHHLVSCTNLHLKVTNAVCGNVISFVMFLWS